MLASVEKRELSYTVSGNVNFCHCEKHHRDSLKTRNHATIGSSNPTPGHIYSEDENSNLKICMHAGWKKEWQPTPVFLLGKTHGQRSLVGYSPRAHRVGHDWSDWTSMHHSVHSITIYNTHDMEATCLPQQTNGWRRCSIYKQWNIQLSSVQSLSHVRLFMTPWIAARQASLSITNSWISHKKWNNAATLMDLGNNILSEISDIWRKTNIVSHVYSKKNTNELINVFTK